MALPGDLTVVSVHANFVKSNGTALSYATDNATMTFTPTTFLRSPGANVVVVPTTIGPVQLDATGNVTVTLFASDDPDEAPQNVLWKVVLRSNVYNDEWLINVPYTTSGTLELADLAIDQATLQALGSGPYVRSINGQSGDVTVTGAGGVSDHGALTGLTDDDHTQYFNTTRGDARYVTRAMMAAPSGIPTLDSGSKIPVAQLPADALVSVQDAASQALMLGLTAQPGDICRRTDVSKMFVLRAAPATTLANWVEWLYPAVSAGSGLSATLVDARGDLIVGLSNDNVQRLPASATDGQVLTIDNAAELGMKWATPTGGTGGDPGGGTGTITSVNGDPGPEVLLDLKDIGDVYVPEATYDENGDLLTPGPPNGAIPQYNSTTDRFEVGPLPNASDHNHDDKYAPLGYTPPYNLQGIVLEPGETAPDDLPVGALIIDQGALGFGGPIPSDVGFKSWVYDPATGTSTTSMGNGDIKMSLVPIRGDWTLTHACVYLASAGAGVTVSRIALYDLDGNLIQLASGIVDENGVTTDFNSAGAKFGVMTPAVTRALGDHVYVAAWCTTATTFPTMARGNSNSNQGNLSWPGTYATRFALDTGGPASGAKATVSFSNEATSMWAGVV